MTDNNEMMLIDRTGNSLKVLPPPDDCCPICATKHPPQNPHNAQSLYYRWLFAAENGKCPSWEDAMKHSPEGIKEALREHLKKLEIDPTSTNVWGNLSKEELQRRLNAK